VAGYSVAGKLIAACPPDTGNAWPEEEIEDYLDFVDEKYKKRGYTFFYITLDNIIGYKKPKKVRVLTFKELQDNPKVKLIIDNKHCVIRVNHEDNELSIVPSMFHLLGTEIELDPLVNSSNYEYGKWCFEPWMYKEC
jgi:hypothetical protein